LRAPARFPIGQSGQYGVRHSSYGAPAQTLAIYVYRVGGLKLCEDPARDLACHSRIDGHGAGMAALTAGALTENNRHAHADALISANRDYGEGAQATLPVRGLRVIETHGGQTGHVEAYSRVVWPPVGPGKQRDTGITRVVNFACFWLFVLRIGLLVALVVQSRDYHVAQACEE
jgi:hypothetical protein